MDEVLKMANLQIALGNETIDRLIEKLKEMKTDNNKVIRLLGEKNQPGLVIVHKDIDIEKIKKSSKK